MSEPTAAPAHEGIIGHVRDWFTQDVEPRLEAVESDAKQALNAVPGLLGHVQSLAGLVTQLAKTVDPAAGPAVAAIVAEAEKVATEAAEVAGALAIKM